MNTALSKKRTSRIRSLGPRSLMDKRNWCVGDFRWPKRTLKVTPELADAALAMGMMPSQAALSEDVSVVPTEEELTPEPLKGRGMTAHVRMWDGLGYAAVEPHPPLDYLKDTPLCRGGKAARSYARLLASSANGHAEGDSRNRYHTMGSLDLRDCTMKVDGLTRFFKDELPDKD